MPDPQPPVPAETEEARRRREQEQLAANAEAVTRVTEPAAGVLTNRHAPRVAQGVGGGVGVLNNTMQAAVHLNAAASGPREDRVTNALRAGSSGASVVQSGAQGMAALARGDARRALTGAAGRAGTVATVLTAGSHAADLVAHGPNARNLDGLASTGASALGSGPAAAYQGARQVADIARHGPTETNLEGLASTGASALGAGPGMAYQAGNLGGRVAVATANRTAVQERMYPRTAAAGRAANSGTRVVHDDAIDAASRSGEATERRWIRDGASSTAARVAGATSAMGHAVANTVRGVGAAGVNAAYGHDADRGPTNVEQVLGVRAMSPYELSRIPEYDPAHPPSTARPAAPAPAPTPTPAPPSTGRSAIEDVLGVDASRPADLRVNNR
jgi:hypothetical protein